MNQSSTAVNFNDLIKVIRQKLPIQNPLHSFVHNNILLMFEGQDFHEALGDAGKLYRANPYWPLHKYILRFQEGKITESDLFAAIESYQDEKNVFPHLELFGLTSKEFFYRLMFSDLAYNDDEVQPNITDTHLWALCQEKMAGQSVVLKRSLTKWRAKDYWEKYHHESVALSTQPYIIRLISSYLDQGQSFWSNPFVNKGFWSFFTFDVLELQGYSEGWQDVLTKKVKGYEGVAPEEIIQQELKRMGIPEAIWETYLLEILFDLKGWAGMVNKLETEPWQATVKAPSMSLVDYLAALLLVESSLDVFHAQENSLDLSLIYGRQEKVELHSFQLSLALYQITQSFKLDARWMHRSSPVELVALIEDMDTAENQHRVRLWHEAFEHHFYRDALSAIIQHSTVPHEKKTPYAQVLFCIDDREESIRRHLEEVDSHMGTYGVVGFFGIDMNFSSLKNQRLIAQCPPVVNPSRIVMEISKVQEHGVIFTKLNNLRGGSTLSMYYNSRTLFRGFVSTIILGMVSLVTMFLQVFFPKFAKALGAKINNLWSPTPQTEINLVKSDDAHGYSKEEQAIIVSTILKMCGMENTISPLVIMMGHGSSSRNNPFRQAYGCGACGGNAGIPNSRAFTQMGNDPEVRRILEGKGISIPPGVTFVSGFHDTCTDEMHFFDLESLPLHHKGNFEKARKSLDNAARLNAFERCQRFSSDLAKTSPDEALKHVKERAEDLAQPRPEYGHSSNALAIVAKRDMTKGLYLNRRSFLLTYDWQNDPNGDVLLQVVLGGVPVCVNINMDYFFSCVDNENFGCGSKLPLNMTSLLGVMTGSQGDLRIGLARQMIEIHEPIRNMTIIEAPLALVQKTFDSHPRLRNILYHHWFRLVVLDPQTNTWHIFGQKSFRPLQPDRFNLKHFHSSMDMINGHHAEEDFAEIDNV